MLKESNPISYRFFISMCKEYHVKYSDQLFSNFIDLVNDYMYAGETDEGARESAWEDLEE